MLAAASCAAWRALLRARTGGRLLPHRHAPRAARSTAATFRAAAKPFRASGGTGAWTAFVPWPVAPAAVAAARRRLTATTTPTATAAPTALELYDHKLRDGLLVFNEVQARLVARLDRLARRVVEHEAAVLEFAARVEAATSSSSSPPPPSLPAEAAVADKPDAGGAAASASASSLLLADPQRRTPRGLYLWGGVGTGKSLCMDLFFSSCALPAHRKRRVHFHNFMLDVHAQIRAFKLGEHPSQQQQRQQRQQRRRQQRQGQNNGGDKGGSLGGEGGASTGSGSESASAPFRGKLDLSSEADALLQVAEAMAHEHKLLCFDEFQVTDVADALLMNKLFSTLLARGTVVVATSNRPIDDLYAGGLNRQYFLPFLSMFKRFMAEAHVPIDRDYRLLQLQSQTYFGPNDGLPAHQAPRCPLTAAAAVPEEALRRFEAAYEGLVGQELLVLAAREDEVAAAAVEGKLRAPPGMQRNTVVPSAFNRTMLVPEMVGGVARFTFDELCGPQSYTGAADFQALCDQFHTLVITDIPVMTAEDPGHNSARRFITLIDQMYESGTRILCSAAAPTPDLLFDADTEDADDGDGDAGKQLIAVFEHDNGASLADPAAQATEYQHGKLASVLELEFAFQRAASRLAQMTGPCQRAVAAATSTGGDDPGGAGEDDSADGWAALPRRKLT